MERRQFRAPRGIRDVLPEEIPAWRFLEETARRLAELRDRETAGAGFARAAASPHFL